MNRHGYVWIKISQSDKTTERGVAPDFLIDFICIIAFFLCFLQYFQFFHGSQVVAKSLVTFPVFIAFLNDDKGNGEKQMKNQPARR